MTLTLWTPARFTFPLPQGHRFPVAKYAMLRDAVIAERIANPSNVIDAPAVADDHLRLVHDPVYVEEFNSGTLSAAHQRRIGLTWSPELVERSRRAVGGTLAAARHALKHGVAMNLAGGTHHAFAGHGEGFCVYNDSAISIRALQNEGLIARVAIVDLDVHQGNGTHSIFAGDESVYTFSMHGEKNYPFERVPGTLDVELPDRCDDEQYLALLRAHLPNVLRVAQPDLVIYIAGADPHENDMLGRLALTFDGLAQRDTFVLASCRDVGIPVAVTIGGGYNRRIEDTVAIHVRTARIASTFF